MATFKRLPHFYLSFHPAPGPDAPGWKDPNWTPAWPVGCWSVYQTTGDEIARRYRLDELGNVTFRDSWPGYVGTWETLAEAVAEIEHLQREGV